MARGYGYGYNGQMLPFGGAALTGLYMGSCYGHSGKQLGVVTVAAATAAALAQALAAALAAASRASLAGWVVGLVTSSQDDQAAERTAE
ncbi:hypothetical protein B0A55_12554, partial [Friedmanniomyces simplex]